MANTLNLAAIFKSDAEDLRRSREKAIRIHGTNIRAAPYLKRICMDHPC